MGVGAVSSMNSMSGMQMPVSGFTDTKSKKVQNEITQVQRQMQKLSSDEELSVDEKSDERKKLQQEISSLNTELQRYEEESLKAQKRKEMLAELREYEEPAEEGESADRIQADGKEEGAAETKTDAATVIFQDSDGTVLLKGVMDQAEERGVDAEKKQADETEEEGAAEEAVKPMDEESETETGISGQEMYAMVFADDSEQQEETQDRVIAGIRGDIAVLKGEISQDKRRGVDTDQKQEELEKLQRREERARELQNRENRKDNETKGFPFPATGAQAAEQQFTVAVGN